MPDEKRALGEDELIIYHEGVMAALNEKAFKFHIGSTEPENTFITAWIDTSEEESVSEELISLTSLDSEEEVLTFNQDDEEDLTSTPELESVPLTFNEELDDESLTFNEDPESVSSSEPEEDLVFNEEPEEISSSEPEEDLIFNNISDDEELNFNE